MGAKVGGGEQGRFNIALNNEINVTPFVDVMLVLLIIFMVVAPLASVSIPVKLPETQVKPKKNPDDPIYVTLQADGKVYIGDFPVDVDNLGQALIKQQITTDHRLFFRADEDVEYKYVKEVFNNLQDNQFYKLNLVAEDKGK